MKARARSGMLAGMPVVGGPGMGWHLINGGGIALLLGLLGVLLWDASPGDLALARWMADANGFAWRRNTLFIAWTHESPRAIALVLLVWICAGFARPTGCLLRLDRRERGVLALAVLIAMALPGTLKQWSLTSCPWDLAPFGGMARYVSHWQWGAADGGSGHCFPAGHAAAGYAFIGGWFVFRASAPAIARRWLVLSLLAGTMLGLAQQWRGAHFMSHTLWTAWLSAAAGFAIHETAHRLNRRAAGARPFMKPGRS